MITEIRDDYKMYTGLTKEQAETIKEDLTLDNDAYLKALRYSKYKPTRIPEKLRYYRIFKEGLVVPRGYYPPFLISKVEDHTFEKTVKYPKIKVKLRDSQKEAYNKYIDNTDKGILILPTGKGKSILGLYIAHALKQKTLVIVHKDDLVSGWKADAKVCFGDDLEVGIIKAKKKVIGDQVTIATIQTLNKQTEEYLEKLYKTFGLVIVDELHHAGSKSYELINNFSGAYRLGLTATYERDDNKIKVIDWMFGGVGYRYEIDPEEKDILPVEVIMQESQVYYEPHYRLEGNKYTLVEWWEREKYKDNDLIPISTLTKKVKGKKPVDIKINYHDIDDKVLSDPKYLAQIRKDVFNEFNLGRNCILFFSKKWQIDKVYEVLSEVIDPKNIQKYYGDATDSKDLMKARAESGECRITLATYSIATEGTNVKAWEVAFLCCSLNSGKNVEQAIGRIRRTKEGKLGTVRAYDYTHPNVFILANHKYTRLRRYKDLQFKVVNSKGYKRVGSPFTRGFNGR